jgi:hypothetical protein
MKNILKTNRALIISSVLIILSSIGCSNTEPTKEPQFRVANDHSGKANVQIKTTGGNTININDVDSAYRSPYQSAAQGLISVTANAQGDTTTAIISFNAMNGETYTVKILNTLPTSLSVVSP